MDMTEVRSRIFEDMEVEVIRVDASHTTLV